DLPLLARHLAGKVAQRLGAGRRVDASLPEVVARVGSRYAWPGNIRELENLVERIMVFRRPEDAASEITEEELRDLAPELFVQEEAGTGAGTTPAVDTAEASLAEISRTAERLERERLLTALRESGGNRELAAKVLGISRTTLWRRLRDLEKN